MQHKNREAMMSGMTRAQVRTRRLEISVELNALGVGELEKQHELLGLNRQAAILHHELARLDLLESTFAPPMPGPTVRAAKGE